LLPALRRLQKDSAYPFLRKLRRLFQEGTLGDAAQLKDAVRTYVRDMTFQVGNWALVVG
jgi:hypothetical protein